MMGIEHVNKKFDKCAGCHHNAFRVNDKIKYLSGKIVTDILCKECKGSNFHAIDEYDARKMELWITEETEAMNGAK